MRIIELVWDEHNVTHIVAHSVTPIEVKEACFSKNFSLKSGKNRYLIFGKTRTGRYLFIVAIFLAKGKGRVITARDMDKTERQLYKKKGG